MKRKKGFTLIEIIICLSMLTLISVGSFIGINIVNNKLVINELSQITDKAVQAAQVYIETNKEAYNQLYSNQNGVLLPLNLLINEGLLSLDNTNLNKEDIKEHYVISHLGLKTGNNQADCTEIDTNVSWEKDAPIYLCLNSSNTLDNAGILNKNNISTYEATGENPNNWVKFEVTSDNTKEIFFPNTEDNDFWRIVSINGDGEIQLLYHNHVKQVKSGVECDKCFNSLIFGQYETLDILVESIPKNNFLLEKYNFWYYWEGASSSSIETVVSSKTKIHPLYLKDTISNTSLGYNWLNVYSSVLLGSVAGYYHNFSIYIQNFNDHVSFPRRKISESDLYFNPVITLKSDVKIVVPNCDNNKIVGSKECPYTLECSNCS